MAGLSLEQARELIRKHSPVLPAELTAWSQVVGRALAETILAPTDLPERPQSAVDGYALGSAELPAESTFELIGSLTAGEYSDHPITATQCLQVVTGGVLPPGTVAVVPHERTRLESEWLTVREAVKTGNNIKTVGEDYRQGEALLYAEQLLDAGANALLAAFGIEMVSVYRRPRVVVLSLADNLVPSSERPGPAQVRDSNAPMLCTWLSDQGVELRASYLLPSWQLEVAADSLCKLWEECDLMISSGLNYSSGGGELERLKTILGAQDIFSGVDYMPGSHVSLARANHKLLLSLSGNPGACAVGYHLLAVPILQRMQGRDSSYRCIPMTLVNDFAKKSGSRRFIRAFASCHTGSWVVKILEGQKPSMIRSLVGCNALIDVPAGNRGLSAGEMVQVYLL